MVGIGVDRNDEGVPAVEEAHGLLMDELAGFGDRALVEIDIDLDGLSAWKCQVVDVVVEFRWQFEKW